MPRLSLLTLSLLLLGACDPAPSRGAERPAAKLLAGIAPDSLVYARASDSLTLDPAAASDAESAKVIDAVFETLIDFHENGTDLQPGLATEWRPNADRRLWTLRLREGVRFHDGTPLDAEAVRFSLDRLRDSEHEFAPKRSPYSSTFGGIVGIQVMGPTQLKIELSDPSVVFPRELAMFCASIVSPTAVKKRGNSFGRNPVGSGAWRFADWQPGRISLTRHAEWWGQSRSSLQRVEFVAIPDAEARREMLKTGRVQAIDDVDPNDLRWLAATPGVRVLSAPGLQVCYLAINNSKPPFDQPEWRRAIAHAIDRQRLVDFGYAGAASVAQGLLPASVLGSSKAETEAARSLKELAATLDKSRRIKLWYMRSPRQYVGQPRRVAEIIRDCLREAGLEVALEALDWSQYRERLRKESYDLAIAGWTSDNGDPDNFYRPILSHAAVGATNYARHESNDFESLLAAARAEENAQRRGALYGRIADLLAKTAPIVPLVHGSHIGACNPKIEGFELHPIKHRLANVRSK